MPPRTRLRTLARHIRDLPANPLVRRVRRTTATERVAGSLMAGLGGAVGLLTGLLAALLIALIGGVQQVAFGNDPARLVILLAPAVGGFVVGLLVTYVSPEASSSGVVQVMRTISLRGGRFRGVVPFGGMLASGTALGTGASGGREGPIVLIGGSVGSLLGRAFAVDEDRVRTLVAAGAAGGIGASFNAPLGGMLFAIELIIGGFRARSLQVIVIASVVASVTAREVIGPGIIYKPEIAYQLGHPLELLLYAVLGLLAVVFGLALYYGEDLAERFFHQLRLWRPLRLAMGGLGVGLVAMVLPEVLGTGDGLPPIEGYGIGPGTREPIQNMLDGALGAGYEGVALLLLLAVAKVVATSAAMGSGSAVGTFAPSLFIGAATGGALGHSAQLAFPGIEIHPGAFALVGMAAVFSAAARAPLTAIVIAFELTGDYGLVLPLMLSAGIAVIVAERIQPLSVYTRPLRKEGIVYAEPEDIDIMQTVKVGEIMTADPDNVRADVTLPDLQATFRRTGHHGFPVVDAEDPTRLVGIVTLTDLARTTGQHTGDLMAQPESIRELTAGDIATHRVSTVTPDDPVFRALRRMAALNVGRLPVVDAEDHSRLIGLVRRADIVQAYQRAVTRNLAAQQREQSRLRNLGGTHFVDLRVTPNAPAAGRAVRDVDWPERTILISVSREGELIMPHGDTRLEPDDEVTVLTASEETDAVRELLAGTDGAGEQGG